MTSKIHILIAEDDHNIRLGLVDTLESEGYQVTAAADGNEAFSLFQTNQFDLLLLDIMMPGKSGYDLCREIRAQDKSVPVMLLTAKGEEIDKVVGLQLGADDYMTKPFGIHELLARIQALLRRSHQQKTAASETVPAEKPFSFGTARVDPSRYKLEHAGKEYDLSTKELQILVYMHQRQGQVVTRDQLLTDIWGINYHGTTRTLDQHIAKLRKKVEPAPASPVVILTVHGVGYRYDAS